MTYSEPARTTTRRIRIRRIRVAGLLVVIAAIAAALGYQVAASSSSTASPPRRRRPSSARSSTIGALGEADGAVPDGTTVFDDEIPGVAKLDPALLGALRQAATDAAGDGVEVLVDSGWRSPEYQEQLLHEAVSKYGSEAEAARWVATPNTSAHVSGDAVDIGPSECHGVAVRARRRVRAVPDLRQRTLALRTAPRSRRSRLPAHVRRPDARPEDAAVTVTRTLRPLAALALIAMVALISACGSSAPAETGTGSGSGDNTANHEKAVKFAECMREQRRQRVPGPGRVGQADHRCGRERLVGGPEHSGVQAGHRRVQGPGASGVHGQQAEHPAAAGGPQVRPVHSRERREGLPGPRPRRAPGRHESNPIRRNGAVA